MLMKTVNIKEAQNDLSQLIDAAAKGESFVIERDGKPLVKVVAVEAPPAEVTGEPKTKRRIGFLDGQFSVPDDFDTMYAKEIEEMFYGKQK
jgi:prevent-host-death family protein